MSHPGQQRLRLLNTHYTDFDYTGNRGWVERRNPIYQTLL